MARAKSTARTLIECRRRDWPADLVERRLPKTFVTKDFLGFADVLALDGQPGVLALQACTTDVQGHLRKIEEEPRARAWLRAGNRLEVWSFRRVKVKRGGVAIRWALRRLVAEAQEVGIAWDEAPADRAGEDRGEGPAV